MTASLGMKSAVSIAAPASLDKVMIAGFVHCIDGNAAIRCLLEERRAAPHLPAGIFSPYSDGEKDASAKDFANFQRCRKGAEVAVSPFSPSLYGEKMPAGR
ncbi:hypothetical protein NKJ26_18870 [Mesorhizobium sp. M0152]|uniref:hypothetical protein n=1 Tax=Mesorhizobium sp. M0152 TaxID=2956898 RepID=UPI0033388E98